MPTRIIPRTEKGDIRLAVCKGLCQALPSINRTQFDLTSELLRQMPGQRPLSGVVLFLIRLKQPDAELQRREVGCIGSQ